MAIVYLPVGTQQIGIHEISLCILLGLEILCSSKKIKSCVDVERMVFHMFGIALSVYHLRSCGLSLCCYPAYDELKSPHCEHNNILTKR